MLTLDSWAHLLLPEQATIECPEMKLIAGRDPEEPIFVGPGHIDISHSSPGSYTILAASTCGHDAADRLRRAWERPYETLEQFRLIATDYQGIEWNAGWTVPEVKGMPKIGWPLTGKVSSLTTHREGPTVSAESGVELVFQPGPRISMEKPMVSVISVNGEAIERSWRAGRHELHVLGSPIKFFYKANGDCLWVTARTSDKLQHPYLENWLGEPFRILFGQLIYPSLIARNFGNGTAQIWLRLVNPTATNSRFVGLSQDGLGSRGTRFWETYTSLLTFIAGSKDHAGNPNFQSNPVTRFYEEIIQAMQGSRWILCMTLSSAAEGLANLMMRPQERVSDFEPTELTNLKSLIEKWNGSQKLRSRILGEIARASQKNAGAFFRALEKGGVLKKCQVDAWSAVRNAVMHGTLVSPWATREEDERLFALRDLVHRLTEELISRFQSGKALHVENDAKKTPGNR